MIATTTWKYAFKIPEDNNLLCVFEQNDLSKWQKNESSGWITYIHEESYMLQGDDNHA